MFARLIASRTQEESARNAMRRQKRNVVLAGVAIAAALFTVKGMAAQSTAATTPAFEVASIKPSRGWVFLGGVSPDRFVRSYDTLVQLLMYAYDVEWFQIQGGDRWTRDSHFVIEAKAAGLPTSDQMRAMVRSVLAERFSVKVHTETRELPRYALIRARTDGRLGDRLRPSPIDCRAFTLASDLSSARSADRFLCAKSLLRLGPGSVTLTTHGYPISDIARSLQGPARRSVVDKTGLTGTYDVDLEVEMPQPLAGLASASEQQTAPGEASSLFTALEEQLGLKLKSERGPVDVLVIEHAEQPTPN